MARYVIQKHTRCGSVHWDLMLEAGDVLKTYRLNLSPAELLSKIADAEPIQDHDMKFLTYEGPVNKGTGSVAIEDAGTFEMVVQRDDLMRFKLQGRVLTGNFVLGRASENKWRFGAGPA